MIDHLKNIELLMNGKVINFVFDDSREMCKVFLRFQEYYESPNPKFRGHFFTLDEFKEWYKTTRPSGEFTYYDDWAGFNFPSSIMDAFKEGGVFYKSLNDDEKTIVNVLSQFKGKYYVIATFKTFSKDNTKIIDHEMSHALYFFNNKYKNKVNEIINSYSSKETIKKMEKKLIDLGYDESKFLDEINAYLANDPKSLVKGIYSNYKPLETKLKDLKLQYTSSNNKPVNKTFETKIKVIAGLIIKHKVIKVSEIKFEGKEFNVETPDCAISENIINNEKSLIDWKDRFIKKWGNLTVKRTDDWKIRYEVQRNKKSEKYFQWKDDYNKGVKEYYKDHPGE